MGIPEAEDGGPAALPAGLPDDGSVEERGGLFGLEVVVEVEVAGVGGLVGGAEVELAGTRLPLGGEEERRVVAGGIRGGLPELSGREVGDGAGGDGGAGVAELGTFELAGGGPGGEDVRVRKLPGDEADGLLVEDDHAAVGEVILGREGVGRTEPDGGGEGGEAEGGDGPPEAEMAAPLDDADEEDEGVHGEEIAGEQSSAEDGEGEEIGEQDGGDGEERCARETEVLSRGESGAEGRGGGREHGDEQVHVHGEVQGAMPQAERHARGIEVGGCVVAEELGIAEDEAGAVKVIRVPGDEGKNGGEESGDELEVGSDGLPGR